MFKPLSVLGNAVKEKLAVLSASTCASSYRSSPDDEGPYRDTQRNEEEARGLLQGGYRSGEEDEDDFFVSPKKAVGWAAAAFTSVQERARSPAARRQHQEEDEEEGSEEAAINALMKLRPSMCDSLGDDETDDDGGSSRPLMGTERASLLIR